MRLAGIEPTTPWFVAKYSIQLSYSRIGGEDGIHKEPQQLTEEIDCTLAFGYEKEI